LRRTQKLGKMGRFEIGSYRNTFMELRFLLLTASLLQIFISISHASTELPIPPATLASQKTTPLLKPWYHQIESLWGGHLKTRGSVSYPDEESFFRALDTNPLYDASIDFRLQNILIFSSRLSFETAYEVILFGGDTWQVTNELAERYPDLFNDILIPLASLNDDRRLMDLTQTIIEDDRYVLYHRLDRFFLTFRPKWGVIRAGRQAITWGNGFLFNPMDLFNPFAPTNIERDYKVGEDMLVTQFFIDKIGDFEFLYVPRRDPMNHNVEWDQSSLAGKLHFFSGTSEFDIMVSKHYEDEVIGLGSRGYLGNTAWRLDATWTFLNGDSDTDDFLSLVANMDYSWVWWQKNLYGFIEFYYNGLGNDQLSEAYRELAIIERFARGEMFIFGRTYMSAEIQVELHPLFRMYLTAIQNLSDASGTLQPRAIWDVTANTRFTFGAFITYGEHGSEFGGFRIPQTDFIHKSSNSAFAWFTWYF